MSYNVVYACASDQGLVRGINQDNFVCHGRYMRPKHLDKTIFCQGELTEDDMGKYALLGVFDGLGGEQCGEIASKLAAREAAVTQIGSEPDADLYHYCMKVNDMICTYTKDNHLISMGTTAALLAFSPNQITLCNIGDSKIFRYRGGELLQLSVDHLGFAPYGMKAPLSQCLGIPPEEIRIEPHIQKVDYRLGDVYLICSDGLTDMVPEEEIAKLIKHTPVDKLCKKLLRRALDEGGVDNVTVVACKIEGEEKGMIGLLMHLFDRITPDQE